MNHRSTLPLRSQRGAVLLIGMVMLMMLTLIGLGVIRMSTRHTQVVNNEQVRSEAVAAANFALDTVLNAPYKEFVWDNYKGNTGTTINVNVGAVTMDDTADKATVPVTVKKLTCKRGRVLKNSELFDNSGQITDEYDKTCIYQAPNPGLTFGSATNTDKSLCGTVLWEMEAAASDPALLEANAAVVQGVELRVRAAEVDTVCK